MYFQFLATSNSANFFAQIHLICGIPVSPYTKVSMSSSIILPQSLTKLLWILPEERTKDCDWQICLSEQNLSVPLPGSLLIQSLYLTTLREWALKQLGEREKCGIWVQFIFKHTYTSLSSFSKALSLILSFVFKFKLWDHWFPFTFHTGKLPRNSSSWP